MSTVPEGRDTEQPGRCKVCKCKRNKPEGVYCASYFHAAPEGREQYKEWCKDHAHEFNGNPSNWSAWQAAYSAGQASRDGAAPEGREQFDAEHFFNANAPFHWNKVDVIRMLQAAYSAGQASRDGAAPEGQEPNPYPHITHEWDERMNPICKKDCPACAYSVRDAEVAELEIIAKNYGKQVRTLNEKLARQESHTHRHAIEVERLQKEAASAAEREQKLLAKFQAILDCIDEGGEANTGRIIEVCMAALAEDSK